MSGGGNEPRSTNRMPAGAGKSIPAAASFPTGGDARRRDLRLFAFLACLRAALSDSGVEGAPRPPTAAASTAPTAEASATVAVAPAAPLGGALPRPGRVLLQMSDDPAGLSSELFGARLASRRRKGSISSSDCRCRFIRAPIPSTSIPSIGTTNAIARNSSGLMRATPANRAPARSAATASRAPATSTGTANRAPARSAGTANPSPCRGRGLPASRSARSP